jgi:hypothetical protein
VVDTQRRVRGDGDREARAALAALETMQKESPF